MRASAKLSPSSSMARRMRSRARKPAWPSLRWNTSGTLPRSRSTRRPADAEHDLLADALLGAAAVEAVAHQAVLVVVVVDVGVEQVERDATDLGLPHPGVHPHAGQLDADQHVGHRRQRHGPGVEAGEALLLPAPAVELLAEVAVAVEQADAGQRAGPGRWPPSGGRRPARPDRPSTGAGRRRCRTRGRSSRSSGRLGALDWCSVWNQRGASRVARSWSRTPRASEVKAASPASVSSRSWDSVASISAGSRPSMSQPCPVDAAEQVGGPLVVAPPEVHGHLAQRLERLRADRR